jgi:hypothetical protein
MCNTPGFSGKKPVIEQPGVVIFQRFFPQDPGKFCTLINSQLFADKGYLGKGLAETLDKQGIQLITPLRKNMKPVPRNDFEKAILRRRALIETVFDELKNLCQIEHTRHRSVSNFVVNLMAGIMAYCLSDNKPTLSLTRVNLLPQA